ncbi:MAG: hypothetical protein EBR99_08525, partial [Actinobacteria bacterium]|nr:hypothetical protein [Actinomycetota bacterium]
MPRVSIISVIRSEFLKLRTLRSTWLSFAITAALTIGFGALISYVTKMQFPKMSFIEKATFDPIAISLVGTLFAQFAVGVIGALMITSEFVSGSIRTTLAAVPSRMRVLVAKAAVLKLSVLVVGMMCVFAAFLIGQLIMSGMSKATLADANTLRAVLLAGLYLMLLSLFGFGLGLIIRQTAGTISAFVSILLVLPLITFLLPAAWRDAIDRWWDAWLTSSTMYRWSVANPFTRWVTQRRAR